MLDDDQQHFEKQILKLPEVREAKERADKLREDADAGHTVYQDFHFVVYANPNAEATAIQNAHSNVPRLKEECKAALLALWEFFAAFARGADTAIEKVAVLLTTTDVALKLYAGLANAFMPAARLLKKQQAHALLMDEVQRVPVETFLALAMHVPTVCAFGDKSQKCHARPAEYYMEDLIQTKLLASCPSDPYYAIDFLLKACQPQRESPPPFSMAEPCSPEHKPPVVCAQADIHEALQ